MPGKFFFLHRIKEKLPQYSFAMSCSKAIGKANEKFYYSNFRVLRQPHRSKELIAI